MSNIPKTRVRRIVNRATYNGFFDPTRYLWEVTLDGTTIAEFDNHPAALAFARRCASTAQRRYVEQLERAAYEARRAAEKAADKRPSEFMDRAGRIWALAA